MSHPINFRIPIHDICTMHTVIRFFSYMEIFSLIYDGKVKKQIKITKQKKDDDER